MAGVIIGDNYRGRTKQISLAAWQSLVANVKASLAGPGPRLNALRGLAKAAAGPGFESEDDLWVFRALCALPEEFTDDERAKLVQELLP